MPSGLVPRKFIDFGRSATRMWGDDDAVWDLRDKLLLVTRQALAQLLASLAVSCERRAQDPHVARPLRSPDPESRRQPFLRHDGIRSHVALPTRPGRLANSLP